MTETTFVKVRADAVRAAIQILDESVLQYPTKITRQVIAALEQAEPVPDETSGEKKR